MGSWAGVTDMAGGLRGSGLQATPCVASGAVLPPPPCKQTFGEQNTEAEAHAMLSYAADCGVNFIVS